MQEQVQKNDYPSIRLFVCNKRKDPCIHGSNLPVGNTIHQLAVFQFHLIQLTADEPFLV
jgi:hypothetical protein